MREYNGEKYIVSFTSFGERFDSACMMVWFLQRKTYRDFHLVMTVYEGDVEDISSDMQCLIDMGLLELIVAPENLCPHLKYFYAMKKYWDKPIITLDDDRLYDPRTLELLISKYESLPFKSIVSCCAPVMTRTGDTLDPRTSWCIGRQRLKANQTSYVAMAEGFAGILYPPQCFKDLDGEIPRIYRCLYDDDIFLKVLGIDNRIPVTQVDGMLSKDFDSFDIPRAQQFNLASHNNAPMQYRSDVTRLFEKELLAGFSL